MVIGAVAAGFLIGLSWGQKTRSRLSDATETDFSGGRVTVSVNVGQAVGGGLVDLLRLN